MISMYKKAIYSYIECYDYVLPLIAKLIALSVHSSSSDEVAIQENALLSDSLYKFAQKSRQKTSKQKSRKYSMNLK